MRLTAIQIQSLLENKFQGARKDGLGNIARGLSFMNFDTEDAAKEFIDKLEESDINAQIAEWRAQADREISQAQKTFEDGLRKKYDFKEKQATPPAPTPTPAPAPAGQFTLEAVQEMINKALQANTETLQAQVEALKAQAVTDTRRAELEKAIGTDTPAAFKATIMEGFANRKFEDDAAFNAYIEATKANVSSFAKEMAERGLQAGSGKPGLGSTNKDGISTAVADYIKQTAGEQGSQSFKGKDL